MDFSYSEEQREVQNLARQILTDLATTDRIKQLENQKLRYDSALWEKLAEAGLLGVAIDADYEGMGFGLTELCLVIEEVGRTVAPVPAISTLVTALAVQKYGSASQKSDLLPQVAGGKLLLTSALMENQNEDAAAPALTTARKEGDGWVISGVKNCVPFAEQSGQMLVSAKAEGGVLVALVSPKAAGVKLTSLRVTTYEPQCLVELSDVKVSAADVLVAPADGAAAMQWLVERYEAALCAAQLGATHKMMSMTASYTSERHQFGVPIATFQAVGHRAANCYIDIECLRLVTQQAVSMLEEADYATTEVTVAKVWAGDVGHRVSYAAQHLHGGMGVDRDYPLWRYCLWVRQNEMTLGSSAAQLSKLADRIVEGNAFA